MIHYYLECVLTNGNSHNQMLGEPWALDMFYESEEDAYKAMIETTRNEFLSYMKKANAVQYVRIGDKMRERWLKVIDPENMETWHWTIRIREQRDVETPKGKYIIAWGKGYKPDVSEEMDGTFFTTDRGFSPENIDRIYDLKVGHFILLGDITSDCYVMRIA